MLRSPLGPALLALFLVAACNDRPPDEAAARQDLVEATLLDDLPPAPDVSWRFDPPRAKHKDLGVGEVRTYVIHLVPEGLPAGASAKVRVDTSCDCLTARLLTPVTAEGADVEVRIEGRKPEDIDGVVMLLDEDGDVLAEHIVEILIDWRTFVLPREVRLAKGETDFKVGIYRAFPPNEADPRLDLEDYRFDEDLFFLRDFLDLTPKVTLDYVLVGIELLPSVQGDAVEGPLDSSIEFLVADPPATFTVPVRRKAD